MRDSLQLKLFHEEKKDLLQLEKSIRSIVDAASWVQN